MTTARDVAYTAKADRPRYLGAAPRPRLGWIIVEQARPKIAVQDANTLVAEDYRANP